MAAVAVHQHGEAMISVRADGADDTDRLQRHPRPRSRNLGGDQLEDILIDACGADVLDAISTSPWAQIEDGPFRRETATRDASACFNPCLSGLMTKHRGAGRPFNILIIGLLLVSMQS
jgi:hypothetical protein